MKLYHGSPQNLTILKPKKAKGLTEFENIKGVFLTKTFLHAALYAIGKTLKGKTVFGVSKTKLVIFGNLKPKSGYVYEVDVKNPIKGRKNQYAFTKKILPIKKTKVFPKDYHQYIFRVKDKDDVLKELRKKSK